MREDFPKFQLPKKLEKILAALAEHYAQKDDPILQKLLVNSRYYVQEATDTEGWDGGQYGHTIHFDVPSPIYHSVFDNIHEVAKSLQAAINGIANCQGEYIASVLIDLLEDPDLQNWRENSGVLLSKKSIATTLPEKVLSRIWTPGYLRVFLSHKAEYKQGATVLKNFCSQFGLSCFVAHDDIEPTREWQGEIEKALFSMEAMVLLMTEEFHHSDWTDQEIGVAIGLEVPIVSIRLGMDPYGFIGKYQALSGANKMPPVLAEELFDLLLNNPNLKARVTEALVVLFENSANYDEAKRTMGYLEKIKDATPKIIERLENAVDNNSQLRDCWAVQGKLPALLKRLKQW